MVQWCTNRLFLFVMYVYFLSVQFLMKSKHQTALLVHICINLIYLCFWSSRFSGNAMQTFSEGHRSMNSRWAHWRHNRISSSASLVRMGVAALQDFFRVLLEPIQSTEAQTDIFHYLGPCVDYRFVFVYSTFLLNYIYFKHSFLIFKTKFWFDLVWSNISNRIYVSHKFCNAGAHYAKPPKPIPLTELNSWLT